MSVTYWLLLSGLFTGWLMFMLICLKRWSVSLDNDGDFSRQDELKNDVGSEFGE